MKELREVKLDLYISLHERVDKEKETFLDVVREMCEDKEVVV